MVKETAQETHPTRISEFIAGVQMQLPILLGVIPFGMIYGVLALQAGLAPQAAQAMSAVVFAGSSQFIFAQMVHTGAPALVLVLTVAVVNLRHALYSASVAPYLQKLSPLWKGLLAYLLTDEAYAVAVVHYLAESSPRFKHYFFLGAALAIWSSWQASTAAGILLGSQLPADWSLDFTLALTFIALVVPTLKNKASIAAAVAAGLTALLTFHWPFRLGLIGAALAGIAAGMLWEEKG